MVEPPFFNAKAQRRNACGGMVFKVFALRYNNNRAVPQGLSTFSPNACAELAEASVQGEQTRSSLRCTLIAHDVKRQTMPVFVAQINATAPAHVLNRINIHAPLLQEFTDCFQIINDKAKFNAIRRAKTRARRVRILQGNGTRTCFEQSKRGRMRPLMIEFQAQHVGVKIG